MQFCKEHWAALRAAIDERGLASLVAKSAQDAHASAVRQLDGSDDPKGDFDPLMNAHWAIFSNGLRCGGLYLMGHDDNGDEYCPLCELKKNITERPNPDVEWIRLAADEQLDNARELGLAPALQ